MTTATTQIIISGKDQLSSVVADAGRRMGTELQNMQRNVLNLQNAFVALAGAAALGQIRQTYGQYDAALRDMGKVTSESMGAIAAKIGQVPAELGNATELIQGYYQVISAGITEPIKAMDTLTSSAQAAKAAHVGQAEVIKGITKIMAGYAGDVKTAAEAADLLFTIEKQGQTSFAELIPVIGDVAAISKQLGVDQGEMGAALASVTQTAGSTSQAATQYRMMLVNLMKPTKEMREALDALGVTSGQAAIEQFGLAGTLAKLQEYATNSGKSVAKLFESSEALLAVAALSRGEFAQYNTNLEAMGQRAGAASKAFMEWEKSTQAVDDLLRNTMTNTLVALGNDIMPALNSGASTAAAAIKFVGDNAHDAIGVAAVGAVGLLATSLTKAGASVGDWAGATLREMRAVTTSNIVLQHAVIKTSQAEVLAAERRLAALPIMFRSAEAEQAVSTAKYKLATAEAALATAQKNSTVVARGLSAVVGAMGGPIGVITTLLTAGATAWMVWGNNAENAATKAKTAAQEAEEAIRRMRTSQAFGEDALAPFRADIASAEAMLTEARKVKTGRMASAMGEEEYTFIDEDAIRAAEAKVSQAYARLQEAARINRKKLESSGLGLGAVVTPETVVTGASSGVAPAAQDAAQKAHEKMLTDGKKAAEAIDKWGEDYDARRIKAIVDSTAARAAEEAKNLELVTEFADKYKEIILGETEFKRAQIQAQGDAYRKAGADEVAVAKWVEAEKLKVSRDWSDGARRALAEYADHATNSAQLAQDAISGWAKGSEDALVNFVTTGKMEFSDLANSIISDLARIAIQQSITGPLASAAGDWLFGGGASSAAGSGIAGELSHLMSVSAKGNVFSGPGISAFSNTIVTQPTQFWAKGGNLMGEAGPEAIMPLKRGPDGYLGVRAEGGGGVVINVIESPGNGGRQEQRNEGGVDVIDIFVERVKSSVAGDISSGRGAIPAALSRTYGVSRAQGALR